MVPRPAQHLHLDFETYCDLDLKKVGVHRYVEHASFRLLCLAWQWAGQTAWEYIPPVDRGPQVLPLVLTDAIQTAKVQIHAWNAAFEMAVLAALGVIPGRPISCTMQRALAYGLPARLDMAAKAVGSAFLKDTSGRRSMLKMSRPLKPGAN